MKKSKLLLLIMIVSLLVSCFVGCGGNDNSNDKDDSIGLTTNEDKNGGDSEDSQYEEESNESDPFDVAVGEYIKFGQYEQDNDESNGKEDIEWLVLDKQDGKILVLSKYALDCKPYHEERKDITWEKCTLRTWLNNDFVNTAFSEDEKSNIATVKIVNNDNQYFNTNGGNDTQDKVFLLSIDEVKKYFSSGEERICGTTDYAKAQGTHTHLYYTASGKLTCVWWLRSPGEDQQKAAGVDFHGYIRAIGDYLGGSGICVYGDEYAVRPALWINH